MSDFKMPALGADMEAGTLVQWCVKLGDRVKSGDVIAVVETQKGAIEVEVFVDGVVSHSRSSRRTCGGWDRPGADRRRRRNAGCGRTCRRRGQNADAATGRA